MTFDAVRTQSDARNGIIISSTINTSASRQPAANALECPSKIQTECPIYANPVSSPKNGIAFFKSARNASNSVNAITATFRLLAEDRTFSTDSTAVGLIVPGAGQGCIITIRPGVT